MGKFDKKYVIAIDGGPATGKSSVSDIIAEKLGIVHIDTGAMFRSIGYYFVKNNIELTEENVIKELENIDVSLTYEDGKTQAFLNGENITPFIRKEEVGLAASFVSNIKEVRKKLLELQRNMAKEANVILDGQDIGTVVFPNADFKFFFVASMEKRARKRTEDLLAKGEKVTYAEVKASLEKRDNDNKNRKEAPVRKAEDAIEFDTTPYTKEETAEILLKIIKERMENS